ncbi:hypothetical protein MPER_11321, partial [Moniliophthora perniciosa FA553]
MAFLLSTLTIASFAALARAENSYIEDESSTPKIVLGLVIGEPYKFSISLSTHSREKLYRPPRVAITPLMREMQRRDAAAARLPVFDGNQSPPQGPPPPGYTPAPYPGQQAFFPQGGSFPPPNPPPEYGQTGYDGYSASAGTPSEASGGIQTHTMPDYLVGNQQNVSYQPLAGHRLVISS